MSEPTDTTTTDPTRPRFDVATPTLTTLISATALFAIYLWPTYAHVLRLADRPPVQIDGPLLVVHAWSTVALCSVPALLVAVLATGLRPRRLATALAVATIGVSHLLIAFDAMLLARYGRHLVEVVRFADEGGSTGAGELVGGLGGWIALLARGGAVVALGVGVTWALTALIVRKARDASGSRALRLIQNAGIVAVATLALAPLFDLGFETRPAVFERLHAALPVDLRLSGPDPWEPVVDDPRLLAIDAEIKSLYASRFADLIRPHPVDDGVTIDDGAPNVFVIVIESFRLDAMDAETMPRLHEWAQRGMRCKRHYAGSFYSEQGLYALLYGRHPLAYWPTLNTGVRPQLLQMLRDNGYRLTYTTGHPEEWNGRELFMNGLTFDTVVRQTDGDWPQWDRDAMDAAVHALNDPAHERKFVLSFLISSHFEYRYPPAYEKHTPVERTIRWEIGSTAHRDKLTEQMRQPLLNRYRNCMGFLDDLIADAIEQVDPERTIVIVTGDHGESLLDDGRYGHGFAFSDIQTRVPFVMVGPGIEPSVVDGVTGHADLPLTLTHAMNGRPTPISHQDGFDLLDPETPDRDEALLLFARNRLAGATLIRGPHRLGIKLDPESPRAVVTGAENVSGDPLPRLPDDFPTADQWRATGSALLGSKR